MRKAEERLIIRRIVEQKRKDVAQSRKNMPLRDIISCCKRGTKKRNFLTAVKGKHNLIAEIKFRSPSKGILRRKTDRNLKKIVSGYDLYASALSVVTDRRFFGGSLDLLMKVKSLTSMPVMRKDFIIETYQVYESAYYGADAILLIASLLSEERLRGMIRKAEGLGMHCIVETGTVDDVKKAIKAGAGIIGINNRNLETMRVDTGRTSRLKALIPKDRIVISESGIRKIEDVKLMDTNAVLVGTSLMEADDIPKKIRSLHRCKTKICGIRTLKEASHAVRAGADILGFNFHPGSPRYISPSCAAKIIARLPNTVQAAGVFVDNSIDDIASITADTGIDLIQLHGSENENFAVKLIENVNCPLIKACRISNRHCSGSLSYQRKLIHEKSSKYYALLVDAYSPSRYGGTGEQVKPEDLKEILMRCKADLRDKNNGMSVGGRIIIAGGLRPSNVRDVLALRPFCVDVCSGVESKPGRKDSVKVADFISRVGS
ncbi:MAG: hypothetical protein R6U32_02095 [Candidatus Woesearchaeota archaeon]